MSESIPTRLWKKPASRSGGHNHGLCERTARGRVHTLDQAVELAESANDEHYTPWETLNEEIDIWARRALAANGFGDY